MTIWDEIFAVASSFARHPVVAAVRTSGRSAILGHQRIQRLFPVCSAGGGGGSAAPAAGRKAGHLDITVENSWSRRIHVRAPDRCASTGRGRRGANRANRQRAHLADCSQTAPHHLYESGRMCKSIAPGLGGGRRQVAVPHWAARWNSPCLPARDRARSKASRAGTSGNRPATRSSIKLVTPAVGDGERGL